MKEHILKMKQSELIRVADGVHRNYHLTGDCRISDFNSRESKVVSSGTNAIYTIIEYINSYGNRIDCPLKVIEGWKWRD